MQCNSVLECIYVPYLVKDNHACMVKEKEMVYIYRKV